MTLALSGSRQPGARQAPKSYSLYESLGEDATTMVMGSAYFSVLTPGARLRPHCGPTNIRLRVHIGLDVPSSAAASNRGLWATMGPRALYYESKRTQQSD